MGQKKIYIFGSSLMHSKKGEERPNHKYTSREWKNGSWVYNYGDKGTISNDKLFDKHEQYVEEYKADQNILSTNNQMISNYKEKINNNSGPASKDWYEENIKKLEQQNKVLTDKIAFEAKLINLHNEIEQRPTNINSAEGAKWLAKRKEYKDTLDQLSGYYSTLKKYQ